MYKLGIQFCDVGCFIVILMQLICYINSYYINVVLLGPLSFIEILLLTLVYSRSFLSFYLANSTHNDVKTNQGQYCKQCKYHVEGRDHHCVFIGRCVEKSNYGYFLSYVFYSYLLSAFLLARILMNYNLIIITYQYKLITELTILIIGLTSSIFFIIFTGGLLASSIRSIILGVYTVEEIKKKKMIKYSRWQITKMWFSSKGRSTIREQFLRNWQVMIGEVSWKNVLFVF